MLQSVSSKLEMRSAWEEDGQATPRKRLADYLYSDMPVAAAMSAISARMRRGDCLGCAK